MSSRPLKHIKLRQKLLEEKPFLKKIGKSPNSAQLRKLLHDATPQQIRVLENLIIAHFSSPQIPISKANFKKLHGSRKLSYIKKTFVPVKSLGPLSDAKSALLKIASVLRIFVNSVLTTSRAT